MPVGIARVCAPVILKVANPESGVVKVTPEPVVIAKMRELSV